MHGVSTPLPPRPRHRYGVPAAPAATPEAATLDDPELVVEVRRVDESGDTHLLLARRGEHDVLVREDAAGREVLDGFDDALGAVSAVLDIVRGERDPDLGDGATETVTAETLTRLRAPDTTAGDLAAPAAPAALAALAAVAPAARALAYPTSATEISVLDRAAGTAPALTTVRWVEGPEGDLWLVRPQEDDEADLDVGDAPSVEPTGWQLERTTPRGLYLTVYAHLGALQ